MLRPSYRSQQGLALISVLLIVAILVILAADMLMRQRVDIRNTDNTVTARQGWHYALGGERWAMQLLQRDLRTETSTRDHLAEAWAQPLHRFPFEDGKLFVRIEDANSRFNLNNLLDQKAQLNPVAQSQWQGLLKAFNADAAVFNQTLAYMTGNLSNSVVNNPSTATDAIDIVDVTELLTLPAMDVAAFNRLKPFVTAVPGHIKVNINTAKMPVLQHISPILSGEKLAMIMERQKQGGFATVDEFVLFAGGTELLGKAIAELSVISDFFIISVRAEYASRTTYLQSLVYRDRKLNRLMVIQRQRLTELDNDILTDE